MTALPYQQALSELHAKLAEAEDQVKRYARPVHMVRNCPSDLQREDQAWRELQNIRYQINQLTTKGE
jgi:hypothetical protein